MAPGLDRRWHSLETLTSFEALSSEERRALASDLPSALGPPWAPHPELLGTRRLCGVDLVLPGLSTMTFAVIPGGAFAMGIRPEERNELVEWIAGDAEGNEDEVEDADEVDALLQVALPVHPVTVRPFLLATRVLVLEVARSMSAEIASLDPDRGRFHGLGSPALLYSREIPGMLAGAPTGCRLPCEAEWEWVAREGGSRSWTVEPGAWLSFDWKDEPNAMGVCMAETDPEWVADAWFPDHAGAPSTAVARGDGGPPGVTRGVHSGWQDRIEAVVTACGYRQHGTASAFQALRLARDLPWDLKRWSTPTVWPKATGELFLRLSHLRPRKLGSRSDGTRCSGNRAAPLPTRIRGVRLEPVAGGGTPRSAADHGDGTVHAETARQCRFASDRFASRSLC